MVKFSCPVIQCAHRRANKVNKGIDIVLKIPCHLTLRKERLQSIMKYEGRLIIYSLSPYGEIYSIYSVHHNDGTVKDFD